MIRFIKLDEQTKFSLFAVALSQFFFANGVYSFLCFGVLFVLFFYVQQLNKSGVFTVMLGQHFIQVVASIWLANNLGKELNFRSPNVSTAILASLGGMVALFYPIIQAQKKIPYHSIPDFRKMVDEFSTRKVFTCYVAAVFVTSSLAAVAFSFSGLTQIIISLLKIKWLFFLLFGYQAILKNEYRVYFYLAIVVEFATGFFSFFSDFKTVIYYLVILLLSLIGSINFKNLFVTVLVGTILGAFGLFWTSIKTEYRNFLNGGNKNQNVIVGKDEAFEKLSELSKKADGEKIESASNELLDRIQYTFHFAKAIDRVPDIIPFQNGRNWLDNIEFSTTPRFLNPNKPKLDNSVKATKYTGIRYAGAQQGVSFSLGYFAEFYIDFGFTGMMIGIFLLGLFYAKLYLYFMRKSSANMVFNMAVAGAFFMEFYNYEMDGTYLTGRLFSSLVTFFLLVQFVFPRVISYISLQRPTSNKINF